MKENRILKLSLIVQSFAPLFVLILIQHFQFSFLYIPGKLYEAFIQHDVVDRICNFTIWGDLILSLVALLWIVYAFLVYKGFEGMHCANFRSSGEKINILEDKRDGGVLFLVSFILPLLIDDINTLRGFLVFSLLLLLIILLLTQSNLFYQNPILVLLGYKCFAFKFVSANSTKAIENPCEVCIGITKGERIDTTRIVKSKYIADNVYLIYNE